MWPVRYGTHVIQCNIWVSESAERTFVYDLYASDCSMISQLGGLRVVDNIFRAVVEK